jgi:hypothetical protein
MRTWVYVSASSFAERFLDEEQGLADLVGVRPRKILDLPFVKLRASSETPKRDELPKAVDLVQRHGSILGRGRAA